jgi:hypothetical protein
MDANETHWNTNSNLRLSPPYASHAPSSQFLCILLVDVNQLLVNIYLISYGAIAVGRAARISRLPACATKVNVHRPTSYSCSSRYTMWSSALLVLLSCVVHSLAGPFVDFQVAQPPPLPTNVKQCVVNLFDHTFGNSFGQPALATLT